MWKMKDSSFSCSNFQALPIRLNIMLHNSIVNNWVCSPFLLLFMDKRIQNLVTMFRNVAYILVGMVCSGQVSDSITINNQLLLLIRWNVANDEQSVWLHQFKTDISYGHRTIALFFQTQSMFNALWKQTSNENEQFTNHQVTITPIYRFQWNWYEQWELDFVLIFGDSVFYGLEL